jgi:PAS domain S-box-containing protein
MLSVFIVVPLLVVWSANARVRWSLRHAFEFALLTVSLVLVGEAVFGRLAPDSAQGYLLPYLCLPFLIWAAFRFGSRETATLNFILTVIAIWGTLHGYGLFARTVQEKALLACQGYIIFNSVVSLAVAAVVAQRRQADEELHASFRYARSLLESSLDPLLTISPQGRIMDVNKASELVTGLPREQLIGSNFSDHFTEPQKAETGYQKVLGEGQVRDYPLTISHLSGRTTDVLYNATVYRNEAGAVQGVFAAARDITKRKEAERRLDFTNSLLALFAQKASAREYLDSAVDVIRRWSGSQALGIRIVDEHREIPYESWAGFEPGFLELENRLSLERDNCCCIRAVSAAFEDPDRALLTPAGSFRCDDSIAFINQLPPEKQGRYRGNCMKFGFASLAIVPIRYRDEIIGAIHLADRRPGCFPPAIVEFIESMSPLIGEAIHRFQTEAELAKHRNQLEELVGQRTGELEASNLHLQKEIAQRADAEASLRQSAQDLERSNRDLEQFAYVASHDLQEPLRAVGGYVKLLQHRFPDKLDAAAREYITGAAAGAERMQGLITDLLAFSRVGTQGGAFAPADLNALLSNALNNLQVTITESGAKITSDPLPTLPVDGTQIAQLFQNLIGNAIKFRSERAPEIQVGARQEEERWLFWVRDNGIGIEPQYSGRIFQIFQRLHTRKQYPGTGIGLAICKKIVERHGGEIWVESQLAQGSTFYFSIPEISAKMEHEV